MALVEDILANPEPAKEILIEGLLGKGDLVAFAGRRKNGKTTTLFNLGFSLASGVEGFFGHKITRPCKTMMLLLEDSDANVRKKLEWMNRVMQPEGRLDILRRGELKNLGVKFATIKDLEFPIIIKGQVERFEPDVLIIDNLSRLVSGDYNNSETVDKAVSLAQEIGQTYGCSVIIAAHPKKKDRDERTDVELLQTNSEAFFELLMGSSHLINSADCLWGIAIKDKEQRTNLFLGGMQRYTGEEHLSLLTLDENDQFELVGDMKIRELMVVNTGKRKAVWREMMGEFHFPTLRDKLVEGKVMQRASLYEFQRELMRQGLVEQVGDDLWRKSSEC